MKLIILSFIILFISCRQSQSDNYNNYKSANENYVEEAEKLFHCNLGSVVKKIMD